MRQCFNLLRTITKPMLMQQLRAPAAAMMLNNRLFIYNLSTMFIQLPTLSDEDEEELAIQYDHTLSPRDLISLISARWQPMRE